MNKIADDSKIFRLVPTFVFFGFAYSVFGVYLTLHNIEDIAYAEKFVERWGLMFGYYLGSALPRIVVYIFSFCYIKYNFNKFTYNENMVKEWAMYLGAVGIYACSWEYPYVVLFGFYALHVLEWQIFKAFLLYKKT